MCKQFSIYKRILLLLRMLRMGQGRKQRKKVWLQLTFPKSFLIKNTFGLL